jgi:hypothetical protein
VNVLVQQATIGARSSAAEVCPDLQGKIPTPPADSIESARAALATLLTRLGNDGVHPGQADRGWAIVATLASGLARQGDSAVLDTLLAAFRRPRPTEKRAAHDLLNRHREEAFVTCIDGLVALAARGVDAAIDVVEQASADAEPAVRFHIADRLHELAALPDGRGWALAEKLVRDEHPEVVSATTTSFGPFYERDRKRGVALDAAALEATRNKDAFMCQSNALYHLGWYHLRGLEESAGLYLRDEIVHAETMGGPIGQMMHRLRSWLVLGGEEEGEPSPYEQEVMARTWALFDEATERAIEAFARRPAAVLRGQPLSGSAHLLDDIAHQLYFASGAFDGTPALTARGRRRFWLDAAGLLRKVGGSGVVSASAKALETLEHLLAHPDDAPAPEVFEAFLFVSSSAVEHGYTTDWFGIDIVDRVLRKMAREQPAHFKSARTTIGKIVDAFLDARWQKAYLLARDLDLSDSTQTLRR